jgi:hypothetical protein
VFDSFNVLTVGLYMPIYASFMCSLFLLILYMWYFSNVFKWFPFFYFYDVHCIGLQTPICVSYAHYMVRTSRITVIIPNCQHMFFISGVKCSARFPVSFSGQSMHFIW